MLDAFTNPEAETDPTKLNKVFLVMELFDLDMTKLICSKSELHTEQIKVIIYNMFLSLKYLHSANVIHRDLKPSNILITEDCTIKLCDFGFARSVLKLNDDKKN